MDCRAETFQLAKLTSSKEKKLFKYETLQLRQSITIQGDYYIFSPFFGPLLAIYLV